MSDQPQDRMKDKRLECVECASGFDFTAGEQLFYAERQLTEPRRCPACRRARKEQRSSTAPA